MRLGSVMPGVNSRPKHPVRGPRARGIIQIPGHRVDTLDKTAALRPVERGRYALEVLPFRIDAPAADLVAGEDVRAIHRLALGVLDTVHVGHALEGGKVGKDCALP